ncbi:recombination regulator RecX [Achromobacter deleyi]|uniref:Regulatory protein RecX n=1 Tax=Achromobacter deleyi TaxID=1353891 RepID=A0A7T4B3A4_9BURK|nr:recombination regulator RecX [Achromobacter deleyi]QQB34764.1 recombination regulator RecX [Achromobacter deleyi]
MSWKPPVTSADRLRAKLDDEFETVAKPEGLRRTSDLRRAAESAASSGHDPDSPAPQDGGAPSSEDKPRTPPKGPSLKMRAVGYLSRREHARDELARKLAPHAEDADEVERVLDALEKEGWLSTERFAQSLVHRRASRQGAARIVQELRQHGVDDTQVSELREQLRATEYPRALEVWQKRFGAKPEDRAAYAKQARFLASRGFAHDVIRRILGAGDDD